MSSCQNNEASLEHFHKHRDGESAAVTALPLRVGSLFNLSFIFRAPCQNSGRQLVITCVHLSVLSGGPIWDDALHLQELVGLVAPDDREAKSHVALLQGRRQESSLQLGGIPCEQGLLCGARHEISDAHVM